MTHPFARRYDPNHEEYDRAMVRRARFLVVRRRGKRRIVLAFSQSREAAERAAGLLGADVVEQRKRRR